jgi:hypothetical protein
MDKGNGDGSKKKSKKSGKKSKKKGTIKSEGALLKWLHCSFVRSNEKFLTPVR